MEDAKIQRTQPFVRLAGRRILVPLRKKLLQELIHSLTKYLLIALGTMTMQGGIQMIKIQRLVWKLREKCQKQAKSTSIYSFFISFVVSLSTCHGLFFAIWCSKEIKIKMLNYQHEFYCSSLYCAMPIQMQTSEHFFCVEPPKLHNLYFVACPWKVPLTGQR